MVSNELINQHGFKEKKVEEWAMGMKEE